MKVFQVYKKYASIPKPEYTTANRNSFFLWNQKLDSKVGYLKDDTLTLPINAKKDISEKSIGGIILQDIIGYSSTEQELSLKHSNYPEWFKNQILSNYPEYFNFHKSILKWNFEIFSITNSNAEMMELYLNKNDSFHPEIPKRDYHKLCNITKGDVFRIQINSKSDFTMSGRKQRVFSEYDYLIEYLGDAKNIEYLSLNKVSKTKDIPGDFSKVIDLRKILK